MQYIFYENAVRILKFRNVQLQKCILRVFPCYIGEGLTGLVCRLVERFFAEYQLCHLILLLVPLQFHSRHTVTSFPDTRHTHRCSNSGPLSVLSSSPLEVSHRFNIQVDCSFPDYSIFLWSNLKTHTPQT